MSLPADINDRYVGAAVKAEGAAEILRRVANDPAGSMIPTESGALPSVAEWLDIHSEALGGVPALTGRVDNLETASSELAAPGGSNNVGFQRSILADTIKEVAGALNAMEFSLWEFAEEITDKPNPADFTSWDWAPAVQAAINAPSSGSQHIVKVPRGIRIATTVTVNKGVRFIGADTFDYVYGHFHTDNDSLVMFRIRAHFVVFDGVVIEGAGKTGTGMGIEVGDGATNWDKFAFINDSYVFNFNVGMDIKTQNWRIASGSAASTCAVGFKLTGLPSAADRRNGYFEGANLHSCDIGIDLVGQWQVLAIVGCDFNSCVDGIRGPLVRSVVSSNNFFNGSGNDIALTSVGNVAICGNQINGGTTASNAGHGISVAGNYCSISGNVVTNKGGHGILAAVNTSCLAGNVVSDSDFFDTNSYSGIKVVGSGNSIVGGVSRTTTGGASRQIYGIDLSGASSTTVVGVYVQGNKTAGILPGVGNDILACPGFVTRNKGTASITSAATFVVVNHGLGYVPTAADISITPASTWGSASRFWISNVTATTFQINVDVVPSTVTMFFGWKAG